MLVCVPVIKKTTMTTNHIPAANEVLCHCSGTTRENIQSLFEQGMDMDAISRHTGAISGCGGCEWDIADCLKQLNEQRSQP